MSCVNLIRCPTRWYLMLTLENYYANGCKRKRWRSVKLSKRYLRAPAMIKRKCNPFNQTFLGKSKLQTCNEFLKFTFEVEINLSPYFITWLISLIHRSMKITYNPWLIIRLHVQTKGYYFFLLSFLLIEIPHSDWEARVVNSWKKKMRDYKVIILMRKPIVSRRRNLVWRLDRKKKRAYLFGWSDLQITVWRRFYDNSISWSRKIIDECLTIVCFFEN